MLSNPLRHSSSAVEDVRERLRDARKSLADSARGVRDAADRVADALEPPRAGSRVPLIGTGVAAALGVAYVARKRLLGAERPSGEPGEPLVPPEAVVQRPEGETPPVAAEEATTS